MLFYKKTVFDTDFTEKRPREPTEDRNTTKLTPIVVSRGGVTRSLFGRLDALVPLWAPRGAQDRQKDPSGRRNNPHGAQNDPPATKNDPPGSPKKRFWTTERPPDPVNQRVGESMNQ